MRTQKGHDLWDLPSLAFSDPLGYWLSHRANQGPRESFTKYTQALHPHVESPKGY